MSILPNSATYMASALRNGTSAREGFHKFFECWLSEQDQHLHELISASKQHPRNGNTAELTPEEQDRVVRPLIDRVLRHYEQYYRAKSNWVKRDVLTMLSPSWRSSLEDAFLWIGGWRPSMAFHLLYSKSGLQLEARLAELIRGITTGDLADLSPSQLVRIDELQRNTIREEKELTEKLAKQQETVADTSMVELSHVVTELLSQDESGRSPGGIEEERVNSTLAPKENGLEEILEKADNLRLRTLKSVIDILTPTQAVHFLIAAAELHLRLHEWGKRRDAKNNQADEAPGRQS